MVDSPLSEATQDSLEELFARDPLKLTDADIDRIIEEERRYRAKVAQSVAEGKRPSQTKVSSGNGKAAISVDDL